MDGKLARSCILPGIVHFAGANQVNNTLIGMNGGFEGFLSNVEVFDYTLNPEQVWRLYMAGPGPQYGFLDYLKSLFDPKALSALDYPKQNIVPGNT